MLLKKPAFLFFLVLTVLATLIPAHASVVEHEVTADGNVEPTEEPRAVEEPVVMDTPVEEQAPVVDEQQQKEEAIPVLVVEEEETVAAEPVPPSEGTTNDPQCPDRDHLMRCAGEHLDTNKNGLLERAELQSAIDKLPFWARGILSILGSVDKMMKKCDVDGDDAISIDYDMQHNKETCLSTCFKRRAFKGAFFPDCEL